MLGNVESLKYIQPEIILTGTITLLFLVSFFTSKRSREWGPIFANITLAGLLLAMVAVAVIASYPPTHLFMGMIAFDQASLFFKFIFCISAGLVVIFSERSRDLKNSDFPSYYMLIAILTLGMFFLAMASNLLMIYLALEMVSITSYLLTGYVTGVRRSSEAALKYVIYGGVASGVMIYGFSLIYGLTGTLQLAEISQFLRTVPVDRPALFLSLILSLVGFGFKIAAFPFHMWSPDVYEGSPTPFTAFLSVGPKAAGFAVLLRFLVTGLMVADGYRFVDVQSIGVVQVIVLLSVATMTVGNFVALRQENMKRLLAYSSIAHAGYMLMGLAAMSQEGIKALLFYLAVYLVMNLGAFFVVIIVANRFGVENISGYAGLGGRRRGGAFVAVVMTLFLFSLTGLPPTAGFIGKFYLFGAVIESGLYGLAVIGALNSVVSLYYYVRVVKVMFFDEAVDEEPVGRFGVRCGTVLGALALLTLYLGIFWQSLAEWVEASAKVF